jgi:hypothetical protein
MLGKRVGVAGLLLGRSFVWTRKSIRRWYTTQPARKAERRRRVDYYD